MYIVLFIILIKLQSYVRFTHTHTHTGIFLFLLNNGKQTINRINFFVKTQWWLHPHPPNQKVQPAYMFLSKHVYEYIHTATVGTDIFISSAILSLCPPPQYPAALVLSGCVPLWPPTMSYLFLSQIRLWVSKNPLVPHQCHVPALSKVSGIAAFQHFLPVICFTLLIIMMRLLKRGLDSIELELIICNPAFPL